MRKRVLSLLLVLLCCCITGTWAGEGDDYGPFTAVKMDPEVVRDVVVEDQDIYVKVAENYWSEEFIVKISNDYMTNYRQWFNGDWEMPMKVYRSQEKNKQGHTYRINTAAKFVEYWTGGKLVLLLERVR
jgi:hypothetical protein